MTNVTRLPRTGIAANPMIRVGIAHLDPIETARWDVFGVGLPRAALPEVEPGLYELRLYLFDNEEIVLRVIAARAPELDDGIHVGMRFQPMHPSQMALLREHMNQPVIPQAA